ncbi:MAG: thioesterase family protein [Clostridium sp.]|jgi:predicted thioesterase|nr:thioesterase family protein [Clostridium sp.]
MELGMEHTSQFIVEEHHSAEFLGSGDLEVLATPALIAFLEKTCKDSIRPAMEKELTSVGIHIELDHLKASLIGAQIRCTSEVVAQEGKLIRFTVKAESNGSLIAQGKHTRAIVDRERFLAGLNK